ncbi:extensin [Drosophila mojavensis]|uniref:DUF4794 domain-containing protein n=1 Tax=Drosophila mojavensis TaxID=7230 RepID=B4K603_DROMO|nr:extensin [Drosophila mojavensis]EDW16240.2 uncharacterized protein Dmoj_GI10415 [Drosophila mojavensis]
MHSFKVNLLALLLALSLCISCCQGARRLRKKPKVYNALITTDDNLTSSRAYPVIQPTIHEPGYAPFGPFNPFGFYSPPIVRFGQPLVPGLPPNERLPYPLPTAPQYPPVYASFDPNQPNILPGEQQPPPQPQQELAPQAPTVDEHGPKELKGKEKLPLPLNDRGLPPVLIPLSSQFNDQPNDQLPPYPFQQFPVIYDQAGYARQRENYLPPYDYYPSQGYPTRSPATDAPPVQQPEPEVKPLPLDSLDATPSFDDIKNGSENKNIDVPDVPPPPIPSGPKRPRPKDN